MAVPRFFSDSGPLVVGEQPLSAAEAAHARKTRRLRPGDEVVLFDGRGAEGQGEIVRIEGTAVVVEVRTVRACPPDAPARLTLITAMPKGPRQDVLVEKSTELGVAVLCPVVCARSVVKPGAERLTRWRRIATEACKQAQRAWLPIIEPPGPLQAALERHRAADQAWIAHPGGEAVSRQPPPGAVVVVAIGPEGGFTDDEVALARSLGYAPLCLGRTLLRTESAALAATARLLL